MLKYPAIDDVVRKTTSLIQRNLPSREWDWQIAALTIALVLVSSFRLVITEWVPELEITERLGFLAVVLGLGLGYSSFNRAQSIWASIEYGIFLIPLQLLGAIDSTGNYYYDLRSLFSRMFISVGLFVKNQPVSDQLFFLLLTSICFWVSGVYVGYQLTRHRNFLHVVLPPGLIILVVQIYDGWMSLRAWTLAVYIFVALILLGRLYYLDNKANWKKKRIFLTSDTEWEYLRSVLLTAALVVAVAWLLPSILTSIKPAAQAWKNFNEPILKRLSDAVTALDSPYGSSANGDFYGSDLRLGDNAASGDTPVFYVHAERTNEDIPRYYWQGQVYNQYADGKWTNTNSSSESFSPDQGEITLPNLQGRVEVTFTFTMNFSKQNLLYAPPEMIWVNQESNMTVHPLPGKAREVTAWFANTSLMTGDRYKVRAMIANPTIQNLRSAGTNYPEWVADDYLQIPQDLQPQLKQLAESITADDETPYDKAQAITVYLRNEIKYQTKLTQSPPRGKDPLMWVLFDYKKGFCMYYASAEVLLLRSIGIPARMAVGFAEGEYDEQRDRYVVARFNSHAWPEVYFPQIGWVEFEPTANQTPLDRPQEQIEASSDTGIAAQHNPPLAISEGPDTQNQHDHTSNKEDVDQSTVIRANPLQRFLPTILLVLFSGTILYLIHRYSLTDRLPVYLVERYDKNGNVPPRWLSNWATWAGLLPIERAFQAINLSLRWLGEPKPAYTTSAERAQLLSKLMPSASEPINQLAKEHQTALFTPRSANLARARRASLKVLLEAGRIRLFRYKEYLKQRYN